MIGDVRGKRERVPTEAVLRKALREVVGESAKLSP